MLIVAEEKAVVSSLMARMQLTIKKDADDYNLHKLSSHDTYRRRIQKPESILDSVGLDRESRFRARDFKRACSLLASPLLPKGEASAKGEEKILSVTLTPDLTAGVFCLLTPSYHDCIC